MAPVDAVGEKDAAAETDLMNPSGKVDEAYRMPWSMAFHLITGTAVKISNASGPNWTTRARWKLSVRSFGPTGNSARVTEDDYNAVAAIANPESVTSKSASAKLKRKPGDIMALTKAMAEAAGEAGWCIHLGATSNDIVDTAVGLQLRDSIVLLHKQLCPTNRYAQTWLSENETP